MITEAEDSSPLYRAAAAGDVRHVEELMRTSKVNESHSINVERKECIPGQPSRMNALQVAAARGHADVVAALLTAKVPSPPTGR